MMKMVLNRRRRWLSLVGILVAAGTTAALAEDAPTEPTSGYDNGFFIQSPDKNFKMTFNGLVQGMFAANILEGSPDTDSINVQRARIYFKGHMFNPNTQYAFEYDLSQNKMRSTYIQLAHSDPLKFRIGQWKVPFDFEALSHSRSFQIVERSISYLYFGIFDQREPGLGINGELNNKKLEYELGMFNGEGMNTVNRNNEFRYAGRLVYNVMGKQDYTVSDLANSAKPSLAFGAAAMFNDTPDTATIPAGGGDPTSETKATSFTFDAAAKCHGFGALGEFLFRHADPDVGVTTDDKGWLIQAGYFVVPEKFEIAGRVSQIYVDGGSDLGEYTMGLNYYFYRDHRVKLQFAYSALTLEDGVALGDDELSHRIRAQIQVRI